MTGMDLVPVRIEWSPGEFTTYLVAQGNVPDTDQIRWRTEECDAFVITLDAKPLSDELAAEIAARIVKLPVDWVETFGPQCEYLHDLIDAASVSAGRQEKVGDGIPMTAWHRDLLGVDEVISYVRTGGQGTAETKVVVVIGPDHSADTIARRIAQTPSSQA